MRPLVLYGLLLALVPTLAWAQVAPATPASDGAATSANRSQIFALMQQAHQQLRQLHQQTRMQMLAALTPAHRTLVANVVGQLAIAPNPNPQAAAQQLDAVLSGGEKQSIVNLDAALKTNARNVMEAQRARIEATLTTEQRTQMSQRVSRMHAGETTHSATFDPGAILLRTVSGGWHGMSGEHWGPHVAS